MAWATAGLTVLSLQHLVLTQALDGESIPLRSSLSRVSLWLDTVVVSEADELEEDAEQCLSCLEGVIGVEG